MSRQTHRLTFAILALSALLLASVATAQAPNATVAAPLHDAGVVTRGDVVSHTFTIANEGDALLEIREVRPACGCTVASFDETIAPGATGSVTAELSTGDFRGPVSKYVTVFTNDLENPRFRLTLRADIRPLVDVLPGYGRFLHVQGTAPKVQTQTLWSTDETPLTVEGATSSIPQVAVEYRLASSEERSPEGPERQWLIIGTLASDAPAGPLTGSIRVQTNHPEMSEISVPIGGYVRPQLLASPPLIDFGSFPAEQPRKASVLVTSFADDPVAITGVETDVPGLVTEIEEQAEGRKFAIHLTLESTAGAGPFEGKLTIRSSNPNHPETVLPVRGSIQ